MKKTEKYVIIKKGKKLFNMKKKKDKKHIARMVLGAVLSVLLILVVILIGKGVYDSKEEKNKTVETKEQVEVKETKEEIAKKMEEILKEFEKDPKPDSKRSIDDRVYTLDKSENKVEDVVSDKALSMVHFADAFQTDDRGKRLTTQTMLALISVIKEQSSDKELKVRTPILDSIYLDKKTGTAYVPMQVYTGQSSFLAFEMQKVDNEWKLNPYSIVNQIQLSNQVSEYAKGEKQSGKQ